MRGAALTHFVMSELKTCGAKAAELIQKMVFHQYSTEGEKGGHYATIRAVKSAIVLADEMISHLNRDGIAYWGRYWVGVKDELQMYLPSTNLDDLAGQYPGNEDDKTFDQLIKDI